MIVVADTSPINYLVRCGYAGILPELFGRVAVPSAVIAELKNPDAPAEVRSFAHAPPLWLDCARIRRPDASLPAKLGKGECEAITLAAELHADVLLIDDFAGRREAELRNIPARGTLAVLLQAGLRGILDFASALENLKGMGFRVSRTLEHSILETFEAEKNETATSG